MLVVLSLIFVVDTKIICSYDFVAPLRNFAGQVQDKFPQILRFQQLSPVSIFQNNLLSKQFQNLSPQNACQSIILEVKLFARSSLLVTFCSLLFTFCLLLFTFYLLFRADIIFRFYIKHGFVYKLLWKVFSAHFCSKRDCIAGNIHIECEIFRSYFTCHGENLDKIFTLRDCSYKFSEINVLKSLVTIRMNEIFPCLARFGQKLNFLVQKSKQR